MYLERTLNAQVYFAKALERNREVNLRERLEKLNTEYNKKLEEEKNIDSIDYQIKTTRERLTYIITELKDRFDNYTTTDFVFQVARLDYLEQQKEKQEKVKAEQDLIKETFGDFNMYHEKNVKKHGVFSIEKTAKTSEELVNERNERLSIANKLLNNNQISKEEFVKITVAVRRRYDRSIKSQAAWEIKQEENQKPSKFKQFMKRVKSVFHLGAETEKKEKNDIQSNFYSEYATCALIKAYNSLSHESSKILQKEASDCLTDAYETNQHSCNIYYSEELKDIINDMFKSKKEHIEKTTTKTLGPENIVIVSREEAIERKLNDLSDERLSYFSILNNKEELKSAQDIKDQALELQNYILKNYKHTFGQGVMKNGSIELGELLFEDKNIQKCYNEIKEMFKKVEDMRTSVQNTDKNLNEKCERIFEKMKQSSI